MEKVDIFLDDWRTAPSGYEVARDFKEFTILLDRYKGNIGTISFDFDLDSYRYNGLDAAKYVKQMNIEVEKFRIHSSHDKRKLIYEFL